MFPKRQKNKTKQLGNWIPLFDSWQQLHQKSMNRLWSQAYHYLLMSVSRIMRRSWSHWSSTQGWGFVMTAKLPAWTLGSTVTSHLQELKGYTHPLVRATLCQDGAESAAALCSPTLTSSTNGNSVIRSPSRFSIPPQSLCSTQSKPWIDLTLQVQLAPEFMP